MKKLGLIIIMTAFAVATFAQYSGGLEKYSAPSNQTLAGMPQANANAQAFTPAFLLVVVVYGVISLSDQANQRALYGNADFQKNLQLSQLD